MSNVVLPNTLTNGQPNDADEVMANFAAILAAVNGDLDLTNLALSLANGFLKLDTIADRRIKFGTFAGSGMGAANRKDYSIPHGEASVPIFAFVVPSWINSGDASTGNDEVVTFANKGVDATNINVMAVLSNAATASVGPGTTFWVAVF